MELLKPLDELDAADSRMRGFPGLTPDTIHALLAGLDLNDNVPEGIRSYFVVVRNVALYGWFFYPFFTVAMFLAFTAVEMAVRERLQDTDPKRDRPFQGLLREARDRGLIDDPHGAIVDNLAKLRNEFAHPENMTILLPSYSFGTVAQAREIINSLFPGTSTQPPPRDC